MRFILPLVLLAAGCATRQPEKWQLPQGDKLVCEQYEQKECGLSLKHCTDTKSVHFECLTEAKYLGPGDHFEPDVIDERRPDVPQPTLKGTKK